MEEQPTKTNGEIRVRTEFNPSLNGSVDQIKQKSAELINIVDCLATDSGRSEKNRLINLAMTSYEEAAMWAVKAATA
jgi:hypothetical protein